MQMYTEKQLSLNIFTNFVAYIPSTQKRWMGFTLRFNKNSSSILVRSLVFNCPYCPLGEIELTDQSKLMLERKTKIIKIENDQQTG